MNFLTAAELLAGRDALGGISGRDSIQVYSGRSFFVQGARRFVSC